MYNRFLRERAAWAAALVLTLTVGAAGVRADDWTPLWTTSALSQAREDLSATALNGKIYFAGGTRTSDYSNLSNAVDIYDVASGTWSTAALSQARWGMSATSVGGKALFAGGSTNNGLAYSNRVDLYNSATNSWSTSSLSLARYQTAAGSAGGKALFGGGSNGTYPTLVDVYDAAGNAWSTSSLSEARYVFAAASEGNKAFFGGGFNGNTAMASNAVDVYDGATGTWSTAAPLSQARYWLASASTSGKVMFAGGNAGSPMISAVDIYDAATLAHSTATLSVARNHLAGAATGNKIIFGGGFLADGSVVSAVDVYDTTTSTWVSGSLSQPRARLAAAASGNKILFAGGETTGGAMSGVVDIYTLQNYLAITSAQIFTLVDTTTVAGRMQLNAPGSLALATFDLSAGSMSGNAAISLGARTLTAGADGTSAMYSGAISGTGSLNKSGAGMLELSGVNSYAGPTGVNQGKLIVSGSLGATAVGVSGGAALGGTGSIAGDVIVTGGNSPATSGAIDLRDSTVGGLILTDPSTVRAAVTLGGAAAGNPSAINVELGSIGADFLAIVNAKVAIKPGGALISVTPLPGVHNGTYDLITFAAGQATGLENLSLATPTLPGGYTLALQTTPTAEQLVVTPEPSLVGLLAVVLMAARSRYQSSASSRRAQRWSGRSGR